MRNIADFLFTIQTLSASVNQAGRLACGSWVGAGGGVEERKGYESRLFD